MAANGHRSRTLQTLVFKDWTKDKRLDLHFYDLSHDYTPKKVLISTKVD